MILSPKSFAFPFSGDLVRNLSSFRMRHVPCGAFTFKIVVVGNPGVGKTSLVYRFTEGRVPAEYRPTIGVNILTKVMYLNATTQIKWIIWDTGDMGRLEYLRNALFKGAAAILFVFDKTLKSSPSGHREQG
jgi:small GTP-binding protein